MISNILFAYVGGLLLNLMPCVLPVLSMKVLHVMEGGEKRSHSIFYILGILISFWILFGVLSALKASGRALGWGFQLQSPVFVAFTAIVFLLLALNLFGAFEWGAWLQQKAGTAEASTKSLGGAPQAFLTGVLAVFVASPCSAPFMGPALAYALSAPALAGLAVFSSLGLGLATPFLLIGLWPAAARALPRPGPWMNHLKKFLGLCMMTAVVWLISILWGMLDRSSFAWFGAAMVAAFAGAMAYGQSSQKTKNMKRSLRAAALILIPLSFLIAGFRSTAEIRKQADVVIETGVWLPYSKTSLEQARHAGPVFVDFTADWCLSCKVNEKAALGKSDVMLLFKKKNVILFRADWTVESPEITEALAKFDRNSVPLYVLYPGKEQEPRILPQILTPAIIQEELKTLPDAID
ncbi:MAG TPA: thioredoxin family protein [Leptospiraceae bacterium]|nr:thioredoxin family protein [Leptospiraceae bacterium]HNN60321.1 thioredoxin family protein [Leptospiraceae bacterium]